MSIRQRLLVLGLVLIAAALIGVIVWTPRLGEPKTLSGYVEGEPLYLSASVSGAVDNVMVQRGQTVARGQPLFIVDPNQLQARRLQAEAQVAAAQAEAQDSRQGQRPTELAVFEAEIAAAEAQARDARADFRRISTLTQRGVYAPARLDDARAAQQAADAAVAAARRRRDAAQLGQREGQVRAADSRVRQSQAELAVVQAQLGDLAPRAPGAARVEDVFYQPGEWVAANQPVVSLLPDDRIRLRFFVPEGQLSAYKPGSVVRFSCDGCRAGLTARVTAISPRPEFTPPVIYSRSARDRLVYRVEALPSLRLNPGQPVDVVPLGVRP